MRKLVLFTAVVMSFLVTGVALALEDVVYPPPTHTSTNVQCANNLSAWGPYLCAFEITAHGKMDFTVLRITLQQELDARACEIINEDYFTPPYGGNLVTAIRGVCRQSVWAAEQHITIDY